MPFLFLRPGAPLLVSGTTPLLVSGSSGSGGGSGSDSVPAALTGLTAGAETSTTVALAWTAPPGAATITVNYRPHGTSSWTTATSSLSGAATSYTVTGLTAATAYDFQVFGADSTGSGTADEVANVSTASGSGSGGDTLNPGPGFGSLSDVRVLVVGQSNANFTFNTPVSGGTADTDTQNADLGAVAAAGIQFWTGSTTAEIDANGNTMFSGNALYPVTGESASALWLVNPNLQADGVTPAYYPAQMANPANFVDPSQWGLNTASGSDGQKFTSYIASLTTQQIAAIKGMWVYWHESDSSRSYLEKATFKSAYLRFIQLVRAALGTTASAFPVFDWGCMPSLGSDAGMNMVREVVLEIAANSANNLTVVLPQAADCNPRDSGGSSPGPDSYHADNGDYERWLHRAALPIARAIFNSLGYSTAIPAGVGTGLGPAISAVSMSANVATITIEHDIGTDLVLSADAQTGVGWVIMDGGSVTLPGNLITALSAARVDATHLAVTFLGIPCNPLGACRLYYPYGNDRIGNPAAVGAPSDYAVTDNASAVARPSRWDPGATLGDAAYDEDMPIQMPFTVTESGSSAVAACGFLLGAATADLGPYGFNAANIAMPAAASYTPAPNATITSYVDDGSNGQGYTAPAGFQTGITSSPGVLPTSFLAASRGSGGPSIWYCSNPVPATAGSYYMVGEGLSSSGAVVSRITRGPFTVT
jgi:hypothetical protein